jgi:predicted RNase H-like HicB family nuclease
MREYTVIYERGDDGGWGAYAPDLPGLGVAAETFEEVEVGFPVPEPTSIAAVVAVPV